MLVLLQASFAKAWGRGFCFDNLTLDNYHYLIFEHETALTADLEHVVFSGSRRLPPSLLALLPAYVVEPQLVPFAGVLAFLAWRPSSSPASSWRSASMPPMPPPPLALYGTAAIIILAFTARFLPIAFANAAAAMGTLHPEMEEAARILGCGRLAPSAAITAPLLRKSLLGGWLIVFIVATRELSHRDLPGRAEHADHGGAAYDLSEAGNFELLAALGGILLAITLPVSGSACSWSAATSCCGGADRLQDSGGPRTRPLPRMCRRTGCPAA